MKRFISLFKIIVPIILLGYLFSSGMVDVRRLFEINDFRSLLVGFILLIVQLLFASWRWQILLASQSIHKSLWEVIQLTVVGMFFSIFLPGAFGGDLAKAFYIARSLPTQRASAVTTVVIDRWMGLFALICSSGLFFIGIWLFYPEMIELHSNLRFISIFIVIAMSFMILMSFVVFNGKLYRMFDLSRVLLRVPFGDKLLRLADIMVVYGRRSDILWRAFVVSFIVQLITPVLFLFLANSLNQEGVSWLLLFLFVPLVMLSNAVPISTMGLGVGETAMITLLSFVLPSGVPNQGGEMVLLFRLLTVILSLPGGLFIWAVGKPPTADVGTDHSSLRDDPEHSFR